MPSDFSLISVQESDGAAHLRIPLTSLRSDYQRLGQATASAMTEALAGRSIDDVIVEGASDFVERSSTGPAPKR